MGNHKKQALALNCTSTCIKYVILSGDGNIFKPRFAKILFGILL